MTNRLQKQATFTGAACGLLCWFLAGAGSALAQNVKWGPFHLNIGFQAGFEYTDNVNTSETDPKADLKLRAGPTVDGVVLLPFTLPNGERLTLTTGISYQYEISLTGQGNNRFSAPVTVALVLPLQIHEWQWLFTDTFSLHNDPLERTVVVRESQSQELSNIARIGVTRNFGRVAFTLQGVRTDRLSPDQPELEETQYQFSFTPAYFFRENYSIFWRNSYGIVEPSGDRPSSVGWSTEVGLNGQLTPNLSGTVSLGFAHSHLESVKGPLGDGIFGGIFDRRDIPEDNVDGISSTVALNYSHPLRPNTTYSFSFFRSPGVTAVLKNSNIQAIEGVSIGLAHRLTPRLTLAPQISFVRIEDVGNRGQGEVADLLSIKLGLHRVFTSRFSGNIDYRFQSRKSNITGQSYDVNRITGSLQYYF